MAYPISCPTSTARRRGEWLESLDAAIDSDGRQRARYLMLRLLERARERQVGVPGLRSTDYINTIPPEREPWFPGDEDIERRIRAYIRWNAAVMVSRANKSVGVGGHIATYASAASLYEVGFNHFFRGKDLASGPGDQVYFQGHAAPGIYARAFLEGRLTEQHLDGFRQEVSRAPYGLSSYPHPRLMPQFWEFPTVSMGLGPISAIYQARFNRYLHARGSRRHVQLARVGLPRRRRDGRGRVPRRDRRGRRARSWTTSPSSSTATCSASTVRSAATARSSRSWRPTSAAPAGTSSRSSGDATGTRCWPATATACSSTR